MAFIEAVKGEVYGAPRPNYRIFFNQFKEALVVPLKWQPSDDFDKFLRDWAQKLRLKKWNLLINWWFVMLQPFSLSPFIGCSELSNLRVER